MRTEYDVLVVGGGPGGAIAAKTAAENGLSTCLVEKRPAIGSPVRCAEGIGKKALCEYVKPDSQWISAEISKAAILSPDQSMMILDSSHIGNKVGYVLERKIFDRVLISQAAAAGADILVKTSAKAPIISEGMVRGAYLDGFETRIEADLVIAADGIESQFSRKCGIDTTVNPRDMMTCAQYLMTDISIEPDMNIFNVGNSIAPQGYLWVFPKGNRTANIGVGIQGSHSRDGYRAIDYLDSFVKKQFPEGKMIEFSTGGVPVCRPLSSTSGDGLLIVGDAARVVGPLTGGGIYNAMYTGRLAGEIAAESVANEDCSGTALASYDNKWRSSPLGVSLERSYIIKEFFLTLSDEKLNQIVRSALNINMGEFSVMNLATQLLLKNPGLLGELKTLIPELISHK